MLELITTALYVLNAAVFIFSKTIKNRVTFGILSLQMLGTLILLKVHALQLPEILRSSVGY